MLTDAHTHLYRYEGKELEDVMARARESGVEVIIAVGQTVEISRQALKVASQFAPVYAAVGIHPWMADQATRESLSTIESLAGEPKVVAISEIGLDYLKPGIPAKEVQIEAFRAQIALAKQLSLPIIIHDKGAHEDTVRCLQEEGASQVGGVVHGFSGDYQMARECLEMGFLISARELVNVPAERGLEGVFRRLPLDGIAIETDSPVPFPMNREKGIKTEPAHGKVIVEKVAQLKGVSAQEVSRITTESLKKLLKL